MAASFPEARIGVRSRSLMLAAAGLVALAGAVGLVAARARAREPAQVTRSAPLARAPGRIIHVPRAPSPPEIDGHLDESLWREHAARSGPFVDAAGKDARPYSEARVAWSEEGGGALYLALYAADIDLEASVTDADGPVWLDDSFRVTFAGSPATRVLEASARGTLSDALLTGDRADPSWSSGARVAADTDATLNDPSDDDEEWTLEWRIPLAALGHRAAPGEQLVMSVRRCDTPRHGPRSCAALGEAVATTLVLDP